ncbi:enoyl-CoA hydratase-related protein [Methylocystis sp. MJC1]|jgi:methylglutaconyl-CoA hydratase|uniref:enoyl-CoA hydratase-related protein n=1 Tax=Methylocystis sp. MJC1 TaxID=2654282 RepID=UPI0013EA7B20|nr:enoyl-CoA hydratase-related protein [Methylocystis sp. MJC1]KAF2989843.1 Short-chain-enoyl-CoA hydratase [Methylocystis sp. MJC1]MBU6528390.1 enoyl-CoA hydratase/isomerase family protein [Methylocystis sp. MJC1]UZX11292.1 enoyl-CoA hydratase-related protein [Methylocystis sp. MJC1]
MDILESIDERGVADLTLNRPRRRNAFNRASMLELTKILRRLDSSERVRVVTLSGAGGNFCAGGDIEWMRGLATASPQAQEDDARALSEMFHTLDTLSKPTLAVVEGAAFGGGVGLVACCDVAISESGSKFSMSEVRLGLAPAVIAPYVVRAVGPRTARALFLTGEPIPADRALQIGLIHQIAHKNNIDAARDRVIDALLLGAPGAQTQTKGLVALCEQRPIDLSIRREAARLIVARWASSEGTEGLSSFLEKRTPNWRLSRKA